MQKVTQTLVRCLNSYNTQLQSSFFTQLKKGLVASKLKGIRKVQDVSYQYSSITNLSGIQSNYMSIKPLQNNYSSIKIINNSGFNRNEENILTHEIDDFNDNLYQKPDYIEKYFNQSKREVVGIENAPFSDYALKNILEYNEDGMMKVKESSYQEYFDQIIRKKKNWRGKVVDKMKFTRDPITEPITNLEECHHQTAIELFESLLQYDWFRMEASKCVMAATHINRLRSLPEEVIEEGYIQILKQLKGHRFGTYIKVFALAAAIVKPPLRLHLPLLNYCISNIQSSPRYFTYIFYLLLKTFSKPRVCGVSAFEADMIMNMKKVPIVIDFPTQKVFYVQCTTSVQDLMEEVMTYFQLDKSDQYLFNYKHGYLYTGNLLDGLFSLETRREKESEYNIEEVYRKFVGYKVLIVLKNPMNYFKSSATLNILFAYESRKYLGGIYRFRRRDIIDLACLKYYSENDGFDVADLAHYVPINYIANYGAEFFANKMSIKLKGITCTKKQARRQFLHELKKKDGFLSHLFQATYISEMDQMMVKVILFISPGYLILRGSVESQVYKKIKFNEIKEWGKSRSEICLKYKSSRGTKVAHVECQNQKLVNEVFESCLSSIEEYFNVMEPKLLEKEEGKNNPNHLPNQSGK